MKIHHFVLALLMLLLAAHQPVMAESPTAGSEAQEEKPLTFMQMVEEAMAQVDGISAAEAYYRLMQDPNILLVDVRDAADVLEDGLATGAVNISLGMLPVRADLELPLEWRYGGLQDRSRPIITICELGPNGARAAKLLDDMGFTDVVYVTGGMQAWTASGHPTNLNPKPVVEPAQATFRPGEY